MTLAQLDVVVIGAGPAGVLAALRAANLGAKTTLVTRGAFGGMAANDGPVPVRTLAHAARLAREARQLAGYGITVRDPSLDYPQLLSRVRAVVEDVAQHSMLRDHVQSAGVQVYENAGTARFLDAHRIKAEHAPELRADRFIICAGGMSRRLAVPGFELTVTPADAFGLTAVPKSLIVIGAGATGVQVASIFNAFGTNIQLFQAGERIIPTEDEDVSDAVAQAFREDGIIIRENFGTIERFERTDAGVAMHFAKDGSHHSADAELAVCAVGWCADIEGLNLSAAGVETDDRGYIRVDDRLQTTVEHIFAAGDITGHRMLVPQAAQAGYIAATNAAGAEPMRVDDTVNPIGSFTEPEYAQVGLTEAQARERHHVLASTVLYETTTRPIIDGRTRGFCKVIVDRDDFTIRGCHIVGERAVEVAQMAAVAMEGSMTIQQIARIPLSFPTYANVFGRAAIRATRELGVARVPDYSE